MGVLPSANTSQPMIYDISARERSRSFGVFGHKVIQVGKNFSVSAVDREIVLCSTGDLMGLSGVGRREDNLVATIWYRSRHARDIS